MSLPWSGKTLKVDGNDNDEVLILDSTDSDPDTINKRLKLSAIPSVSGGVSDGDNLGSGSKVFAQKNGTILEFRTLLGETNKITLTESTNNVTFTLGNLVVTTDQANTYTSGSKQSFVSSSSIAGININNQVPSSPVAGDIFRNTNTLQYRGSTATREIVDLSLFQTLENKTLTAPVISTIINSGTLILPAGPETLVGRTTTDTLVNKTLTFPIISTINNGGTLTLPSTTDTLVALSTTDTLVNKTLTMPIIAQIVNTGTLTLPTSTDNLMGRATSDTFTNKTFDANGTGNILRNVDVVDLANGQIGELISWDSSGAPTTVPAGNSGEVLTSQGGTDKPVFGPVSTGTLRDVALDGQFSPSASINRQTLNFLDTTNQIDFLVTDFATPPIGGNATVTATISNTYLGQTSITTLGIIGAGTWGSSATTIAVGSGGTGATSLTDGGILLGSGTGAITATAVLGNGEILIGDGITAPVTLNVGSSTAITILGTVATGTWNADTISVARGGTASTTVTQGGVLFGSSPTVIGSTTAGTEGQILLSHGTNAPTFENLDGLGIVSVRSNADFPDALPSTLTSVTGTVSNPAVFTFTIQHGYSEGQTVEIITSPTVAAYDGFHVIVNVTTTTFEVSGIDFVSDATSAANGVTRCLAKDTAYIIGTQISTAVGYKAVDFSSNLIRAISRTNNTITMTGAGATFYTADRIAAQEIRINVFDNFQNTYFNIKGVNNFVVSGLLVNESQAFNFGSLGTLDGLSAAFNSTAFAVYLSGFVATNVQWLNIVNVSAGASNGSTFLKIINRQTLSLPLGGGVFLPTPTTMNNTAFVPAMFANDFFVEIDPAAPSENVFVLSNAGGTLGGDIFTRSSTAKTGSITEFAGTPTVSPTTVTSAAHGLLVGMSVEIENSINYNSTFVISAKTTDTFDIPRNFVADDVGGSILPKFEQVRAVTIINPVATISETVTSVVDSTRGVLTVTYSGGTQAKFTDGRIVEIKNTTNGQGSGATGTATLSGDKVISIAVVTAGSNFVQAPTVTIDTSISDAIDSISVIGTNSGYTDGESITLSGGTPTTTATATAVIVGGVVQSITFTNFGAGYAFSDTITITGVGSSETSATFTVVSVTDVGATAVAVLAAGTVIRIDVTDTGTGYVSVPSVVITAEGQYDGKFKIFNPGTSSFDIIAPFRASENQGIIDLQLALVSCAESNFTNDSAVLLSRTLNRNDGGIVGTVGTTTFEIDVRDKVRSPSSNTGIASDASLDGTAVNVLVNTVKNEVNSKAKGSLSVTNNTTVTDTDVPIIFVDLNLDPTTIIATSDTELFGLTDSITGELEYLGLEPFSGQFTATMFVAKNGPGTPVFDLQAIKNGGVMVDNIVTSFDVPAADVSTTFLVSVTAVTGDKFKLQVRQTGTGNTIVFKNLTIVIQ